MRIAIVAATGLALAAGPALAHSPDRTKLPIGDGKLSTSPKVGYIWACHTDPGGRGAQHDGPWMDKAAGTWNMDEKVTVEGAVSWPHSFTIAMEGDSRVIAWNGLPAYPTGIFPIQRDDPAYQYDTNPNDIRERSLEIALPLEPKLAAKPSCAPNAVGVLLSGVVLFNALDAAGRDAVAHETQDACQGHPRQFGVYHDHSVPDCLLDEIDSGSGPSKLVGYALDGFGIYGPRDENGNELSSADLDACHGRTSPVEWNGKTVTMYHYVATLDFPYTIGCLKGTWTRQDMQTISGPPPRQQGRVGPPGGGPGMGQGGPGQGQARLRPQGGPGGFAPPPRGGPPGGRPDINVAAAKLGLDVNTLRRALGPPPPNLRTTAARLGISEAALRQALGVR